MALVPRPQEGRARSVIEALTEAIPGQSTEDDDSIHTSFATALEQIDESVPFWEQATIQALGSVENDVTTWVNADPAREDVAVSERESLSGMLALARQGDPSDAARAWAEENLPIFIYFDDYGQLETRIHLPTYLRSMADPIPRTRTLKGTV